MLTRRESFYSHHLIRSLQAAPNTLSTQKERGHSHPDALLSVSSIHLPPFTVGSYSVPTCQRGQCMSNFLVNLPSSSLSHSMPLPDALPPDTPPIWGEESRGLDHATSCPGSPWCLLSQTEGSQQAQSKHTPRAGWGLFLQWEVPWPRPSSWWAVRAGISPPSPGGECSYFPFSPNLPGASRCLSTVFHLILTRG